MNDKKNAHQRHQGGLALSDIYYVLFRHKWKIVALTTMGLIAAAVIYKARGTIYVSEAEVMIKYIHDTGSSVINSTSDSQTHEVTGGPDGLMLSETAILSSFDLALRVATNIGPAKILAKSGGGDSVIAAAGLIHDNLIVDRMPRSSVLKVTFSSPDEAMVQPILKAVINAYQERHQEIHGPAGSAWDAIHSQNIALRDQLKLTEEKLQEEQAKVGVSDVDASRKSSDGLAAQIHFQIVSSAAELEQHRAMLAKLKGTTNAAVAVPETNTVAEAEIPQEKLDLYLQTTEILSGLRKTYNDLRTIYPEHATLVQEKKALIDEQEKIKKKLEQEEPRLAKQKVSTTTGVALNPANSAADAINTEEALVAALESKLKILRVQAAEVHASITNLDAVAPIVRDLERERGILEDKYKYTLTRLQNEKLDQDIGALKNANIVPIEDPIAPSRERSKTPKMMGVAAAAGLIAGLAWAFLIELYLDHTVKRPKEIEGELGMRLFLSIPDVNQKGHRRLAIAGAKETARAKEENGEETPVPTNNGHGKLEVAPWDSHHSLHGYYEALRDRLIAYFDINNLNHKPKLVAVTGAGPGTGTTTIAAGLAASLSETGDGNVLLVDMNKEHGGAQHFYKGKPSCELDDALVNETRDNAMIQDNFYVVSGAANGDKLSRMLPKRFASLMPKLKASDYDYIIFDMPPISRTGVTQRLAGFMDMMLLVVESEKTSRDVVRQASALLADSKANVSVVLNKTRNYIPANLHQEF